MATRSLIGIEKDNGVVEAIYCHFDGYPAGVGKTLYEHYNNPERIKQLLRLGDMSTLGEFLSEEEKGDRKGDVCFVYVNSFRPIGAGGSCVLYIIYYKCITPFF